ncbi:N-acetylmuramoyl-L-alanine amidase [Paenibacillus sp. GCM10012306]|uniref:peptidoglycan recognition protein family protein n=1 Tax=Paenibacillus sp. GCM10012306 TaxID=3317342 RepID=UPI00361A4C8A
MKQQGNFLLMEKSEFKDWVDKQVVTRSIKKLQVHHTASPNYTTRKMINGVAQQDHFVCLEGMRTSHIKDNGWSAAGQHLTIFEDGKIALSLDRDLNITPAGIKGANTGMICIESIGYFDKGADIMTTAQRDAIVHVYACLADKFKISINTDNIVYHAWFTATGERLSDYTPGKSSKTCPGTAFFGDGNTIAAANKGFIPSIKAELVKLNIKLEPVVNPQPTQSIKDDKKVDAIKAISTKDNSIVNGLLKDGISYVPSSVLKENGFKVAWDNVNKKLYYSPPIQIQN